MMPVGKRETRGYRKVVLMGSPETGCPSPPHWAGERGHTGLGSQVQLGWGTQAGEGCQTGLGYPGWGAGSDWAGEQGQTGLGYPGWGGGQSGLGSRVSPRPRHGCYLGSQGPPLRAALGTPQQPHTPGMSRGASGMGLAQSTVPDLTGREGTAAPAPAAAPHCLALPAPTAARGEQEGSVASGCPNICSLVLQGEPSLQPGWSNAGN